SDIVQKKGLFHFIIVQHILSLRRYLTRPGRHVAAAVVCSAFQIGVGNGRTDGIRIRIFMPHHADGPFSDGSLLLQMFLCPLHCHTFPPFFIASVYKGQYASARDVSPQVPVIFSPDPSSWCRPAVHPLPAYPARWRRYPRKYFWFRWKRRPLQARRK